MRIMSFNANGIRSAHRKGFFDWFLTTQTDILCVQETKAQYHQLEELNLHPANYHHFYFDAEKKGYSGVAIYSLKEPLAIQEGLGFPLCDTEGRYIHVEFKDYIVASLYLPSGTSGDTRQQQKYIFMEEFTEYLKSLSKPHIICGDWNIAHHNIDIKNWRNNQKSSGFLPEERDWLTFLLDEMCYVDTFRTLYPDTEQYTWWSNRANAWKNNVGWRIDYQIISEKLKRSPISAKVYRDTKFSDHAPLITDYALTT